MAKKNTARSTKTKEQMVKNDNLSRSFKKIEDVADNEYPTEEEFAQSMNNGAPPAAEIHKENMEKKPDEGEERQSEPEKLEEQLLRAMAEMKNLRQRSERDVAEARKYGITAFARDMIGVLENLRRAEESIPEEEIKNNELFGKVVEGIRLTREELLKVFERYGIKRIDPMGEKFDHNFHQAIMRIPDDKNPPNTVVQVMQAGYVIHNRLLRPAMVGVATEASEEQPDTEKEVEN